MKMYNSTFRNNFFFSDEPPRILYFLDPLTNNKHHEALLNYSKSKLLIVPHPHLPSPS